jgi:hypothetical protein
VVRFINAGQSNLSATLKNRIAAYHREPTRIVKVQLPTFIASRTPRVAPVAPW